MKVNARIYKDPVLLIGAPRSGTKMLRELLKFHPLITGSSYEEERVWRYGNEHKTSSRLEARDADDNIKNCIRNYFHRKACLHPGKIIVDKNVHNSVRLGFLREIFPDSKIIHIVRDGRDAVCSIRKIWQSPLDLSYIIKTGSFPLQELPFFIKRQVKFYYEKLKSGKGHVKWWGPKFDDWDKLIQSKSLLQICGIQWKRCIEDILDKKSMFSPSQYLEVRYEVIISKPAEETNKILDFLDLSSGKELDVKMQQYVNPSSIGRWKKEFNEEELESLLEYIGEYLRILGYIKE